MSKIIVFRDKNFNGPALILTEADPSLKPEDMNDKISSVIVADGDWDMYRDVNYHGPAWNVSHNGGPGGDGTYSDWDDWGGTNDSISSLAPRGKA